MTRLVHLSDLHFGAHDERLVEAVDWQVDQLKPDLVVISGDFTQRARTEQFRDACEFLDGVERKRLPADRTFHFIAYAQGEKRVVSH